MPKNEEYLKEIRYIAAQNSGFVTPEDVVEFAKNPATSLHHVFTWDDSLAAEKYRLQEARQILRVVVSVLPGDDPLVFRAMVSLKEDRYNNQGYRIMADVLTDERLREILLAEAKEEMLVFMAKYEGLKELVNIFAAMQEITVKPTHKVKREAKYKRPAAQV